MEKDAPQHRQNPMRLPDIEMIGKLELKGMRFHAYHGCLESEQQNGAEYRVDFTALLDCSDAEHSDALTDTIDYSEVYAIVKREMEIPSKLIEHVGARVFHAIEQHFPELARFSITVSKTAPPVGGPSDYASITYNK